MSQALRRPHLSEMIRPRYTAVRRLGPAPALMSNRSFYLLLAMVAVLGFFPILVALLASRVLM